MSYSLEFGESIQFNKNVPTYLKFVSYLNSFYRCYQFSMYCTDICFFFLYGLFIIVVK